MCRLCTCYMRTQCVLHMHLYAISLHGIARRRTCFCRRGQKAAPGTSDLRMCTCEWITGASVLQSRTMHISLKKLRQKSPQIAWFRSPPLPRPTHPNGALCIISVCSSCGFLYYSFDRLFFLFYLHLHTNSATKICCSLWNNFTHLLQFVLVGCCFRQSISIDFQCSSASVSHSFYIAGIA